MLRNVQQIAKFGVVGAGQMGTGIAIVANRIAGLEVKIIDSTEASLSKSRSFTESFLDKEIAKQRMTNQEKYDILHKFSYSLKLEDLTESDFVVEAINENLESKKKVFQTLDSLLNPSVILASNTSSISITSLASFTKRPHAVIGMHFMNPVPVMTLVELIRGLQTSDECKNIVVELAKKMKKEVVEAKDYPGFILNRILMPYINEAIYAIYEGVASIEDIDKGVKLGTNVPMGPLTLADFIGLDTCLSIMNVLHKDLGDSKYRPCPLLVNYVNAGYYGKKSGRGFFVYNNDKKGK